MKRKEKTWVRDDEDPGLLLPKPAFSDDDDEDKYRDLKYQKRFDDYKKEQQTKRKAALAADAAEKDEAEFDDAVALGGEEKRKKPKLKPVIARDFSQDAIEFDYETGKLKMKREIKPQWFSDYNLFKPDDTVVLNGKRRTGSCFIFKDDGLYSSRECRQVIFHA